MIEAYNYDKSVMDAMTDLKKTTKNSYDKDNRQRCYKNKRTEFSSIFKLL
jgi:hypothetical protein